MVRNYKMTLDIYVETLTGKTTGYVSEPHKNLESTKCENILQPNPGSNHTPT